MALQAVGSFSMCIGCWMAIISMGFSWYIRVIVLTWTVTGVVSIQTSGVIWVGRTVVVILHNYKEHLDAMPALLLVYMAVMHVGGLASGWKGVEIWQNCPLACWHIWNCVVESSTPIVASLVTLKYLVLIT